MYFGFNFGRLLRVELKKLFGFWLPVNRSPLDLLFVQASGTVILIVAVFWKLPATVRHPEQPLSMVNAERLLDAGGKSYESNRGRVHMAN